MSLKLVQRCQMSHHCTGDANACVLKHILSHGGGLGPSLYVSCQCQYCTMADLSAQHIVLARGNSAVLTRLTHSSDDGEHAAAVFASSALVKLMTSGLRFLTCGRIASSGERDLRLFKLVDPRSCCSVAKVPRQPLTPLLRPPPSLSSDTLISLGKPIISNPRHHKPRNCGKVALEGCTVVMHWPWRPDDDSFLNPFLERRGAFANYSLRCTRTCTIILQCVQSSLEIKSPSRQIILKEA